MRSMEVEKLDTERDRLSDLPDDLLCHIISLLPVKDTVQTSILSTRWKNLYTLVSTLNLEGDNLPQKDFMNIVDRVLVARKRIDLDKFILTCGKVGDIWRGVESSRVEEWVQYALSHNVKELDLNFCIMWIMMPAGLFTCKALVSLKLKMNMNGRCFLKIPSNVSLPNIKILHLQAVVFSDDDSLERLLSSCFALEELVLESCFHQNITRFSVSNSALKRLTICHYYYVRLNEVVINAPSLVYFKYECFIAKDHKIIYLHSLVEAYIDFGHDHNSVFYVSGATDLLRGLSHVQSLHLSGGPFTGDFLPGQGSMPTFENMTNLKIGKSYPQGWERVLNFAPCLETLVFEELPYYKTIIMDPPGEVPPCLMSQMKAIKFLFFRGRESEMQVVEYFLKHGQVLENLIIHLVTTKDRLLEITEKLLKFPRVSDKCQVVIV